MTAHTEPANAIRAEGKHDAALTRLQAQQRKLGDAVAARARAVAREVVGEAVAVEVLAFARRGELLGRANGW